MVTVPLPSSHDRPRVAVGVMAHNEAASIARSLAAVLAESDDVVDVARVVVVASGCTDGTEDIVRGIAAIDGRVDLIVQPTREGKASAINHFLAAVDEPFRVLIGADVVCTSGSIGRLVLPLAEGRADMTGGRPVPVNRRSGIAGRAAHVMWDLHHVLAQRSPKLGEAVAFTWAVTPIDSGSLVDEVSIELQVTDAGGVLAYVPDAVVRNRAPGTVMDYIRQRRRIHLGHLRVARTDGYRPATMDRRQLVAAVRSEITRHPAHTFDIAAAVALEVMARGWALFRFRAGRGPTTGAWRPITSTKMVAAPGEHVRAFHETEHTLRVVIAPAGDRRALRRLRAGVKRVVRDDDVVVTADNAVVVRFRGNPMTGQLLANRLRSALLPDLVVRASADAESQTVVVSTATPGTEAATTAL